ncbi:MAG: arylsulfatase [Croceicoccus sp.]|nr:arylsulfatase [Croceicoccus sp.]MAL25443.1 arylsulfatase [Croceicoccus sp.]|tara:strand:- start:10099 stop:11562 length:1464 start_codon:yes stop_codon:yes gene_type:complete
MPDKKKPNILVIFGDDIGYSNVSCFGGDIMGVPTPNIDRIADEGIKLTSFYAQPSCTAGRAAFITGQMPARTGLTTVGCAGAPQGMSSEDPTIAQILKMHGYATAQFGKNHLGDREEHLPHRHGFDEFFGNLYHLNANEDPEDPDRPQTSEFEKKWSVRGVISGSADGETKDEGVLDTERMKTFDDEIVAKTSDFMERKVKEDTPFFVWHCASRMHVFTHLLDERKGVSRASEADIYGDGLAEHDGHVGQLLDKLDELGIAEDTIVVYTTDNGAYQYMWPEGGTSPFRGDKGTTWEGGVRVPCVIRYPGKIPPRQVSSDIVAMEDFFMTFAALVGMSDIDKKLREGVEHEGKTYKVHLDGYDQTALFTGKGPSARKHYFYYDEVNLTAVRYGPWKVTIAAKMEGKWDNPLVHLGRPMITNILMDPYERQWGDVNRKLAEHKGWVLLPIIDFMTQHVMTFKEFPPRQEAMSGDFAKLIEKFKAHAAED